MVKTSRKTLRTHRNNREILTALTILVLVVITLICSGLIFGLNVKVNSITARADFHYIVRAGEQQFDLVPNDVLRIERTPAKKAITGQVIEILKIYTTHGFIYAVPDDPYYDGARKLANAADWESLPEYIKDTNISKQETLNLIRQYNYAIGTPESNRGLIFAILGLQNICMLMVGLNVIFLIFPLRLEKDCEPATVVQRVEQPA